MAVVLFQWVTPSLKKLNVDATCLQGRWCLVLSLSACRTQFQAMQISLHSASTQYGLPCIIIKGATTGTAAG
jgi:hypothetical protein